MKRDLVDSAKRRRVIAGQRQRGVTLIELMVALTIFALLLGLALPSFRNFVASNRLSGTAQEFLAALQLARSEAIKRGTQITLRHNATPGSRDWGTSGWTLFVDTNGNGALDVGELVLRDGGALTAPLTMMSSASFASFIAFGRDGRLTSAGGAFVLCEGSALKEGNQARNRAVLVNGAGRVRIARDDNKDGIYETDTGPVASCSNP